MKFQFFLALMSLLHISCSRPGSTLQIQDSEASPELVQGQAVSDQDPVRLSTVGLLFKGQSPDENLHPSLCTATLIAPQVAVTAAHCVSVFEEAHVIFSTRFQNLQPEDLRRVLKVAIHPQYFLDLPEGHSSSHPENESYHDLALVLFEGPLKDTYQPAPVIRESSQLQAGQNFLFAGFGLTSPDGMRSGLFDKGTLRSTSMTLGSLEKIKGDLFFDSNSDGRSVCHGDSGGPVYLEIDSRLHLAGVISRGENDSCNSFSIATGIPAHWKWIEKTLQKWNVRP